MGAASGATPENCAMIDRPTVPTGIEPVGDSTWGAHICLFYETAQDLIDAAGCYFRAGLEDGEFCLWALSDPLSRETAVEGLRQTIPDIDDHIAAGRLELVAGYGWYLAGARFDPRRITAAWFAKLAEAQVRGFPGMRVSGNAFWLEANLWTDFRDYEEELDRSLADKSMIALCTYALDSSRPSDLLEVARTHRSAITRREGRWELLETLEPSVDWRPGSRVNRAVDVLATSFPGHELLTPKERVVLAQVVKGASAKECARMLGISPRTVEFHRANIMRKLGAHTTAELFARLFGADDRHARLHGAA
jgi:DNA-binding CsgD family transcriptional regulator